VPATGGAGGKNAGGSAGAGGAVTGGNGGSATGGSAGNGGNLAGGSFGSGGSSTTGGASGTGGKTETSAYHPCPTDGTACKIMPFGDSITDGYNSDTPGGYRVELFRLAHSAGKNITFVGSQTSWGVPKADSVDVPPKHEGHSGWTIYPTGSRSGISTLLKNDSTNQSVMLTYTPDIVLLMIGTNDAIDNYDMANAPTRLGTLIDTIYDQLPNVLIVVAQPIPSRGDASKGDDTTLSARIKTYDDAIPAVVKAKTDAGKHILLVDMYTPFNPNKASLIEDQWHPNLAGYVLLGTQWYSVLQSFL
jgi:lysophospholipase L1-like esterase